MSNCFIFFFKQRWKKRVSVHLFNTKERLNSCDYHFTKFINCTWRHRSIPTLFVVNMLTQQSDYRHKSTTWQLIWPIQFNILSLSVQLNYLYIYLFIIETCLCHHSFCVNWSLGWFSFFVKVNVVILMCINMCELNIF